MLIPNPDAAGSDWALYFGGPDYAAGRLRDVLAAKIDAQKAGDRILWATYYFCDLDLAKRLMTAQQRGVKVTLILQKEPRYASANRPVIELLRDHPVWSGVTLYNPSGPLTGSLHTKIYSFSGSQPCALIGSFNPSAEGAGNTDVLREIGAQDRGHNLLYETRDLDFIEFLNAQVLFIGETNGKFWRRFWAKDFRGANASLKTFPRMRPLRALTRDFFLPGQINIAASHIKGGALLRALRSVCKAGAEVRILTHHTQRRAPEETLQNLRHAGAQVRRFESADKLPMHAKFMTVKSFTGNTRIRLGSLNYNPKSLWLNDELIFESQNADSHAVLSAWFERSWAACKQ